MLAVDLEEFPTFHSLRYPMLATPKIDGIRCLTMNYPMGNAKCVPVTRSLNRIPNDWIFNAIAKVCPPGFDGEIISGETFHECQSNVMTGWGFPTFKYLVFDHHTEYARPYRERIKYARKLIDDMGDDKPAWLEYLFPETINSTPELLDALGHRVKQGYEGLIIRNEVAPYKWGRSTKREQGMVKIKLWGDSEAVVLDVVELMRNQNKAVINERGYLERSSHASNLTPGGTMGSLLVEDVYDKCQFNLGTGRGFTDELRQKIWDNREHFIGKIVKYKFQIHGRKDKPRIPSFVGFRDPRDMS